MLPWLHPRHIRTKLTLSYVALLGALLVLFMGGTSVLLLRNMQAQLERHAIEDLETIEGLLFFGTDGTLQLRESYHNHLESKDVQERFVEVRSPEGALLYRNTRLGNRSLGSEPLPGEGDGTYSPRRERLADGTYVRVASRRHAIEGHPALIRVAYSEGSLWRQIEQLLFAEVFGLVITLLVAGFAGYALARRALAPIKEMARRADQITSEFLHERLPGDSTDDELGHLARMFNFTLVRLEQSFQALRRSTATVSRELCAPLTTIRSIGEIGLQMDRDPREYREIVGRMLEEAGRLTHLVDGLLATSRSAARGLSIERAQLVGTDDARESTISFKAPM